MWEFYGRSGIASVWNPDIEPLPPRAYDGAAIGRLDMSADLDDLTAFDELPNDARELIARAEKAIAAIREHADRQATALRDEADQECAAIQDRTEAAVARVEQAATRELAP